ncbi:MAG: hypothetical protein IPG67_06040 [Acidobacteria bacterium]|nr:hypothetical protein [Acidobacteriota bacterium]
MSEDGDSLDISRACSTSAIRSPCISCLPEIFTLTIMSLYAGPIFCQRASRVQVSFKIQIVIGMMRPLSSAIGMNLFGGTLPNSLWFQRSNASKPSRWPSCRSTSG